MIFGQTIREITASNSSIIIATIPDDYLPLVGQSIVSNATLYGGRMLISISGAAGTVSIRPLTDIQTNVSTYAEMVYLA